ncbi:MAG: class I SAM-dependent methyltransferase [Bacteroidota bacterium]
MIEEWAKSWDDRYSAKEYAYGLEPNVYLKQQLDKLTPGRILFGADGEGRNGVYAATKGWEVSCFDISKEGKKKALQLAEEKGVSIDYRVGELADLGFKPEEFDAIVLIYAHFPPSVRSAYHKILNTLLRKGGTLILEAFNKAHLEYRQKNPKVGGPPDYDTLFSMEEVKSDFPNYEVIELSDEVIDLNEGLYHIGAGSVVRFVGQKK